MVEYLSVDLCRDYATTATKIKQEPKSRKYKQRIKCYSLFKTSFVQIIKNRLKKCDKKSSALNYSTSHNSTAIFPKSQPSPAAGVPPWFRGTVVFC